MQGKAEAYLIFLAILLSHPRTPVAEKPEVSFDGGQLLGTSPQGHQGPKKTLVGFLLGGEFGMAC